VRLLLEVLGLPPEKFVLTFQSRFGRSEWLKPYTDETVKDLARSGVKRLAIVMPGFAADCLETIDEIGVENAEYFHQNGGEKFARIPVSMTARGTRRDRGDRLTRTCRVGVRQRRRSGEWVSMPERLSFSRRPGDDRQGMHAVLQLFGEEAVDQAMTVEPALADEDLLTTSTLKCVSPPSRDPAWPAWRCDSSITSRAMGSSASCKLFLIRFLKRSSPSLLPWSCHVGLRFWLSVRPLRHVIFSESAAPEWSSTQCLRRPVPPIMSRPWISYSPLFGPHPREAGATAGSHAGAPRFDHPAVRAIGEHRAPMAGCGKGNIFASASNMSENITNLTIISRA